MEKQRLEIEIAFDRIQNDVIRNKVKAYWEDEYVRNGCSKKELNECFLAGNENLANTIFWGVYLFGRTKEGFDYWGIIYEKIDSDPYCNFLIEYQQDVLFEEGNG